MGIVGCHKEDVLEIDKEDLEDIPEKNWEDHVWEKLGGKDAAFNMVDFSCLRDDD